MTTKQTRTPIAAPTHVISTDGTEPESQVGYSTLAQVKAQMSFGTAAAADVGTSGDTVPKNNTANVFSEPQSFRATASAASFGAELVTNGTFTGSATGWSLGAGWAYSTDNVTVNADAAGTLTQSISVVSGTSYYLEFTAQLSAADNALLGVALGGVSVAAVARTDVTSEQSYAVMLTANTTGTVNLAFSVTALSGTGTITLDNVSLKAVTPIPATLLLRNSGNGVVTESRALTSGTNTAIGVNAGQFNTTGSSNTFLGREAGQSNTTGTQNTFVGWEAGQSNTTGTQNTFVGQEAGQSNTTGISNTFLGREAGQSNTTGIFNTFVGRGAGRENTTGTQNTFMGWLAGLSNTTGTQNTFMGREAGRFAGSGTVANLASNSGIMLGHQSRASASGNTNETVIGFDVVGAGSNTVTLGNSATTLQVLNADTLRLTKKRTIASASSAGTMGDMCWDDDYFYVCVATNTWKRTALTTW